MDKIQVLEKLPSVLKCGPEVNRNEYIIHSNVFFHWNFHKHSHILTNQKLVCRGPRMKFILHFHNVMVQYSLIQCLWWTYRLEHPETIRIDCILFLSMNRSDNKHYPFQLNALRFTYARQILKATYIFILFEIQRDTKTGIFQMLFHSSNACNCRGWAVTCHCPIYRKKAGRQTKKQSWNSNPGSL